MLWERLEPLIPPRPPVVNGRAGQPRVPDRKVFAGIVFVLLTGIPWRSSRPSWGMGPGSLVGGVCVNGPKRARGMHCGRSCSTNSARLA
nr:transposase [Leifsonia xyli]